ncbi:MAG TPA: hypothetical protein VM123_15955 [archaeon]|nr:hypothetical protein [archaeon]
MTGHVTIIVADFGDHYFETLEGNTDHWGDLEGIEVCLTMLVVD